MILFLLCALAVASDRQFFGGEDNREYCIMCGEELPTKEMTYCTHCGTKEIIHYIWCKDCAADEQVQGMFEETCRGGVEMNEGINVLMITCPLCQERGKYNDDVLKERNEDVNVEMRQNINDSFFSMNNDTNPQKDNNIFRKNEEYDQDFENQMEQAMRTSLAMHNRQKQEADEWNDEWEQAIEESKLLHEKEMADQREKYEQYKRQREKVDIRGHICSPNKFQDHQKQQNKLNSPRSLDASLLGKKNIIKKRDRSTAHVMITSTYMALLFTFWIACIPGAHIDHTVDKMGYLMQQFSRTYLGFIGLSGMFYTLFSKERAWFYKHKIADIFNIKCNQRDADANISLLMYLASLVSSILFMVGGFARLQNASYAFGEYSTSLVQSSSWIAMFFGIFHFFGLFLQKCSKCSQLYQRSSCVLNDKFFTALQRQPQESIRQLLGMNRVRWRTKPVLGVKGNLTGFFSSFIPFFGLLQACFFFVHKSELTGEQFAENETYAYIGLALGIIFTPFFQLIRWKADIGVFTGEQVLTGLLAWFMAYHSDPQTAIYAIIFQMIFLGIYVLHKFFWNFCGSWQLNN